MADIDKLSEIVGKAASRSELEFLKGAIARVRRARAMDKVSTPTTRRCRAVEESRLATIVLTLFPEEP